MQYLGGKSRLSARIANAILVHTSNRTFYAEPFVGGGSIAEKLVPYFAEVEAFDVHEDLILMWQALQVGWVPPQSVSEATYNVLRKAPPSALRGFVGFGCSWGGKWFGGYARQAGGYNYAAGAARSVVKIARNIARARLCLLDYRDFEPEAGDVVYCDPPYANVTGYSNSFDNREFWTLMNAWVARDAIVFVSEYNAPDNWQPILEIEKTREMSPDFTTKVRVCEKLFVLAR